MGRALMVTVAVPVRSPGCAEQLASESVATVYVVVVAGVTETEMGLEEPLKVVPSDKVPFQGPVHVTCSKWHRR